MPFSYVSCLFFQTSIETQKSNIQLNPKTCLRFIISQNSEKQIAHPQPQASISAANSNSPSFNTRTIRHTEGIGQHTLDKESESASQGTIKRESALARTRERERSSDCRCTWAPTMTADQGYAGEASPRAENLITGGKRGAASDRASDRASFVDF